uniref:Uncharacterized protein n=1 Tax=Chelonoidis abingdonii TaxID=106734 RepID=A0A8C0H8K9_CHEAB
MYIVFFSKAPKKKGGKKAKGGKAAAVVDAVPPEDMSKDQVRAHSISPRQFCGRRTPPPVPSPAALVGSAAGGAHCGAAQQGP